MTNLKKEIGRQLCENLFEDGCTNGDIYISRFAKTNKGTVLDIRVIVMEDGKISHFIANDPNSARYCNDCKDYHYTDTLKVKETITFEEGDETIIFLYDEEKGGYYETIDASK